MRLKNNFMASTFVRATFMFDIKKIKNVGSSFIMSGQVWIAQFSKCLQGISLERIWLRTLSVPSWQKIFHFYLFSRSLQFGPFRPSSFVTNWKGTQKGSKIAVDSLCRCWKSSHAIKVLSCWTRLAYFALFCRQKPGRLIDVPIDFNLSEVRKNLSGYLVGGEKQRSLQINCNLLEREMMIRFIYAFHTPN